MQKGTFHESYIEARFYLAVGMDVQGRSGVKVADAEFGAYVAVGEIVSNRRRNLRNPVLKRSAAVIGVVLSYNSNVSPRFIYFP